MKRYLISMSLLMGAFISLSFNSKGGDCNSDDLFKEALTKLSEYSLLKDYRFYSKGKSKNQEPEVIYYPITLNRGIHYKFLCAQSAEFEGKLVVSLYTVRNSKPDFLFATNYKKDLNKVYESIEFDSGSTMNCLMAFSFKEGKAGCGVGISSFLQN